MQIRNDSDHDGTPLSHDAPQEKACSVCGVVKPLDRFYAQKRGRFGRLARCKDCCRDYERSPAGRAKAKRYEQSAKGKQKFQRYGASGKRAASQRQWRQTPTGYASRRNERKSEAHRVRQRRWRQTAKGRACRARIAARAYATEEFQKHIRVYRASQQRKMTQSRYKASVKGKLGSQKDQSVRRARRNMAGGSYTPQEWLDLCARYDQRCLCCGEQRPLEPDHVVAIARGGRSDIANIQPLCRTCNLKKGTKSTDFRLRAA